MKIEITENEVSVGRPCVTSVRSQMQDYVTNAAVFPEIRQRMECVYVHRNRVRSVAERPGCLLMSVNETHLGLTFYLELENKD